VSKKAPYSPPAPDPTSLKSDDSVHVMHQLAESLKSAKKVKKVKFAIRRPPAGSSIEFQGGQQVPTGAIASGRSGQVVQSVITRASQVLGDRDEALRWLGTPVRGLDFATPISLLGSAQGLVRVLDILGQMEHGIW